MYYTTWCGRSSVRATAETRADVTIQPFGKMRDGTPVELVTLIDGPREARIITYGGILVSLTVPDRHGRSEDVVLGYDLSRIASVLDTIFRTVLKTQRM